MKVNVKIAPESRKDKTGMVKTKNVPLFADIRFAGTRIFYFTGYRIDETKFNPDTQEVNKNCIGSEGKKKVQYNIINKRLKAIKANLELYFQSVDTTTKDQVISLLDSVCLKYVKPEESKEDNSFFAMFQMYIDINVSDGKKRNVKSVMKHWKDFDSTITFESITVEKLRAFQTWLEEDSTHPRGRNTVHSMLKTSRAFWNWAKIELKRKGIELSYPFKDGFTLPGEEYGKPIYITIAERDLLFNAKLETEKLQKVRDIFVFQCLIGARVGDLCKLTKTNIQNNILSYIPRKTKEGKPVTVTVPLHPKAIEILSRYDMPGDLLLPFISDQRYNDYIKAIYKEAKIMRLVTRLNPTTGEPEQDRICDIASSNMARRAFVGNLYGKVDNGIISSMSGHEPGSKSFTRYYDVSKELQQQAINKL